MKKLTGAALCAAWLSAGTSVVRGDETMLKGIIDCGFDTRSETTIRDSLCSMRGEPGGKERSAASVRDCVTACVSYQTATSPKLVFVGDDKTIYQIANQTFAGLMRHAGEPVSLTGDLNGTTLTISKLEVRPAGTR